VEHSQHNFTYRLGTERAWLAAVGAWVALLTATVGAVAQLPCAPAAGWGRVGGEVTVPLAVELAEPVPPVVPQEQAQPAGDDESTVPAAVSDPAVSPGSSGPAQPADAGTTADPTPASSAPAESRKVPERGGRPLRPIRSREGNSTDYWQPRSRKLPA
jgi:hypothetical protein